VRLDADFTREAFAAGMQQPEKSVVHIATHFDSRPGVAANLQMLLGDGSEPSGSLLRSRDLNGSDPGKPF
jgi:CHAT domain-containing protein